MKYFELEKNSFKKVKVRYFVIFILSLKKKSFGLNEILDCQDFLQDGSFYSL